jgi:hypothetical protein
MMTARSRPVRTGLQHLQVSNDFSFSRSFPQLLQIYRGVGDRQLTAGELAQDPARQQQVPGSFCKISMSAIDLSASHSVE